MNVEGLVTKLLSLTYKDESMRYDFPIISSKHETQVEIAVREWALENNDDRDAIIGSLEAKCLVYEAVIGKSNFAPLIAPLVDKPEDDCK